jgi:hypothetical protein
MNALPQSCVSSDIGTELEQGSYSSFLIYLIFECDERSLCILGDFMKIMYMIIFKTGNLSP